MKRAIALVVALLCVTVVTACSPSKNTEATVAPVPGGAPVRYVAIGASESVGFGADVPLREAWTRLLWTQSMPVRTTFVNLAVPGATTADAITTQLPQVRPGSVDVATVWLNVNDTIDRVPAATFENHLRTIVTTLQSAGAKQVLVANTPPLDDLPAFRELVAAGQAPSAAQVNAVVDAYNAATVRVVNATGATLVDLHGAGLAARAEGRQDALVSRDGFHPSTLGHQQVAQQFAAALRNLG